MKTIFYFDGDIIKVYNYNAPLRHTGEVVELFGREFKVEYVKKANGVQKVYLL